MRQRLAPARDGAFLTGARRSELLRLRWHDISFPNRTVSIFRPKTGTADTLPLAPTLSAELEALREARAQAMGRIPSGQEHVFLSRRGRPYKCFRGAWKSAVKRAGLEGRGMTFHCCRHSFACHFLEAGNVRDLQTILGHRRLSTTETYAKAVDKRTRGSVEALDLALVGNERTHSAHESDRASATGGPR